MRKLHVRTLLVVVMALPLGACGSIFGIPLFAAKSPKPPRQPHVEAAPAVSALAEGRSHLDGGRVGLAIEAFQRALATGDNIPAALNGMGVAYARLGRFETSKRFFDGALAMDPRNETYAANLARLMRSPVFAMRHEADMVAELAGPAVEIPQPAKQAAAGPGRLERLSRNEVRIVSVPAQSAPAAARFKALVRIELPAVKSARPAVVPAAKAAATGGDRP